MNISNSNSGIHLSHKPKNAVIASFTNLSYTCKKRPKSATKYDLLYFHF